MKVLLQRVSRAAVRVDDRTMGEIGPGFVALVGCGALDRPDEPARLAEKVWNLRVFEDAAGKMNRSLSDTGGTVLVVSQFTLYADTSGGRRPSFVRAAPPDEAEPRVEAFAAALEELGATVARGVFGADMEVELVNDGPVTLLLEG
ncbi:MAG TPA: D-aminoacyl-tRNA deacylase [Actinomycetota bacterium]|nr:D-aminoacyl-tRNA deacylase [Actinomycetota bacterium]